LVDAGTVHSLPVTSCLLSNHFHVTQPIFFDVHESHGCIREDYASLFRKVVRKAAKPGAVIGSIVIDNLVASGLRSISFCPQLLLAAQKFVFDVSPAS
jgi:hypothetical protein